MENKYAFNAYILNFVLHASSWSPRLSTTLRHLILKTNPPHLAPPTIKVQTKMYCTTQSSSALSPQQTCSAVSINSAPTPIKPCCPARQLGCSELAPVLRLRGVVEQYLPQRDQRPLLLYNFPDQSRLGEREERGGDFPPQLLFQREKCTSGTWHTPSGAVPMFH